MRIRLPALLVALPLAAAPAAATEYFGASGQANFFANYASVGATDYANWSVTFTCANSSDPCAPSNPTAQHVVDNVTFDSSNSLGLRSAESFNTLFPWLHSDADADGYSAATVTATFGAPVEAVGMMLARSIDQSGPMTITVSLLGGGTQQFSETFGGVDGFLFFGVADLGAKITGVTIGVPAATIPATPGSDSDVRFVAIGPMQFGAAQVDTPMPEPATMALLGAGLLGLGLARRRR